MKHPRQVPALLGMLFALAGCSAHTSPPKVTIQSIVAAANRYANAIINVYPPGQRDDMHCHPGSEHIFMVVQGELHIYGVNDGEDVVLKPGELVHINASYYYQLANETDDLTVLYQVATKPAKPVKISRYSYCGASGVDPTTLESA